MILLAIIAGAIWRRAKKLELIPFVWVLIAAGFYLFIPFLAGVILAFVNSNILYNDGLLTLVSIVASWGGVGISWLIMERVAKKKKENKTPTDRNILDDEYLENL